MDPIRRLAWTRHRGRNSASRCELRSATPPPLDVYNIIGPSLKFLAIDCTPGHTNRRADQAKNRLEALLSGQKRKSGGAVAISPTGWRSGATSIFSPGSLRESGPPSPRSGCSFENGNKTMTGRDAKPVDRRRILASGVIATAGAVAAPYVSKAEAGETTVLKVQTSWPAGPGLDVFSSWCTSIKEKSGGELELKPFAAKQIVGDFDLLEGVRNGVVDAMNSFTLYWAAKVPATAFLSSYVLGLRYPHEWDVFFYSKDGLKMTREIFAKLGLYYVNRVQHGPNIIHSKKPIRSIQDFLDLKLRVPGGMIAETFAAAGAKTVMIPGGELVAALEKGTIDAADFVGPAVNYSLGFQKVTKYVSMGPRGLESIYQPVDLMDFIVNMGVWNKLSPKLQKFLDDEVQLYSNIHHAAIQKADMEAWPLLEKAGTEVTRLSLEDVADFQNLAVPIWFKWANKDKDAARVFKAQLEIMQSPSFGYVTPDMVQGLTIDL